MRRRHGEIPAIAEAFLSAPATATAEWADARST
jgi:hypothetical protein